MSQSDPIRIFVTHLFDESEDYFRVFEYLESGRDFFYVNLSKPDLPRPVDSDRLRESLRDQLRNAEVVVALASLARVDEPLLQFQMACAGGANRPVLLVPGFGKDSWLPPKLTELASEIGEWDSRALIDAIRRLARGEDTTRFDTIEFKLDD